MSKITENFKNSQAQRPLTAQEKSLNNHKFTGILINLILHEILDSKDREFTKFPMPPEQIDCLNQLTLEQLTHKIFVTRKLSSFDQKLLVSNLTQKDAMTVKDKNLLDRVFEALNSGLLQVV